MSTNTDISLDQLRAVPLERRLEIVEALWESVESESGPYPTSDEILDEADREFGAHLADPSSSIPWEQVRAQMRAQLGKSEIAPDVRLSETEQAGVDRRLADHDRNPGAAKLIDDFVDGARRRRTTTPSTAPTRAWWCGWDKRANTSCAPRALTRTRWASMRCG